MYFNFLSIKHFITYFQEFQNDNALFLKLYTYFFQYTNLYKIKLYKKIRLSLIYKLELIRFQYYKDALIE